MAKTLYLDCFSGASGDMIIGALLDLGLPLEDLNRALGSLAIEYGSVSADRVLRAGVSATKFRVHEEHSREQHEDQHQRQHAHQHQHAGGHAHDHHGAAHHHHSLAQISAYIDRSALSAQGKDRARRLFRRLAEAEAAIHAVPVEQVHLHEVGAVDSIIDIVAAVFGFEWLGADVISASPLNVGSGTVACAHGTFPVPAPATVRLLTGVPMYGGDVQAELVTPTGALLVTEYATSFGPLPSMRVTRVGYGAGDRDFNENPNVLRMLVGETAADAETERIVTIECEMDDMNPQLFGPLMDKLQAAGALDVFYIPVQMKKNRPGTLVTAIAHPERREAICATLFAETTTIGVRYHEIRRERLRREVVTLQTAAGPIRFKIARRDGRIVNASPEFDDCARAAAERGLPIKDVQALATKAWVEQKESQNAEDGTEKIERRRPEVPSVKPESRRKPEVKE